jgi:carbonic anhydrase
MKKIIKVPVLIFALITLIACDQSKVSKTESSETTEAKKGLVEKVMTKEEQSALTPDQVIKTLDEGNMRFRNNDLTLRNHSEQVRNSTLAQYPKAIVLSCVDSRVPVEDVFDRGIGDLFVARVAGNFVNEDILGSMEFACKVSGSKLILVMGHEHCGAVKAAIDDVKLGNITPMLQKIRTAVEMVEYEGERNSKNQEYVHMVCESNVNNTIAQIRLNSPILNEMEAKGEIKIVGAVYDMDNGQVTWMQ